MAGEPRVELDLPVLVVTRHGQLESANEKHLEQLLSGFFQAGDVVALHIVAEFTGETREFCSFICNQWNGRYSHTCGKTMNAHRVCPDNEEHNVEILEHEQHKD